MLKEIDEKISKITAFSVKSKNKANSKRLKLREIIFALLGNIPSEITIIKDSLLIQNLSVVGWAMPTLQDVTSTF